VLNANSARAATSLQQRLHQLSPHSLALDGWFDADRANPANRTALVEKARADDTPFGLGYDAVARRVADPEAGTPASILHCGNLSVLKAVTFVDALERLVHDPAARHNVSLSRETDPCVHLFASLLGYVT
jgi:hypothetical protein